MGPVSRTSPALLAEQFAGFSSFGAGDIQAFFRVAKFLEKCPLTKRVI